MKGTECLAAARHSVPFAFQNFDANTSDRWYLHQTKKPVLADLFVHGEQSNLLLGLFGLGWLDWLRRRFGFCHHCSALFLFLQNHHYNKQDNDNSNQSDIK